MWLAWSPAVSECPTLNHITRFPPPLLWCKKAYGRAQTTSLQDQSPQSQRTTWPCFGPGRSAQGSEPKQPRNIRSEKVIPAQLGWATGSDWAGLSQTTQLSIHLHPETTCLTLVCSGWKAARYQVNLSLTRHLVYRGTEERARAEAKMWILLMEACLSLSFLRYKTEMRTLPTT